MPQTQHEEQTAIRFHDLATAFDLLHGTGKDLAFLATNLISLAFRDIVYLKAGGLLVPQVGADAGTEVTFNVSGTAGITGLDHVQFEHYGEEIWKNQRTDPLELPLKDLPDLQARYIGYPISFGFDRPIGYVWSVVHVDLGLHAKSRLEYVSKYIALSVRAEKAATAIELLTRATLVTHSTPQGSAQALAEDCRAALSATGIVIWTVDRLRETLKTLVSVTVPPAKLTLDMPLNTGVAGRCVATCMPITVDDLNDEQELPRLAITSIQHPAIVRARGWRAAMYVPMDVGGEAIGVMAAFGPRPRGFSTIDQRILLAFATRLSAGYSHQERMRHLTEMERRLELEAPSIEAGMLAMENVHDSVNLLTSAQDSLTLIANRDIDQPNPLRKEILSTLVLIRSAKKGIAVLTNKAKFTKVIQSATSLREVIQDAVDKIALDVEENGIKLLWDRSVDFRLNLDRDKMARVFLNLLDNSIWFLETDSKPGSKEIKIDTSLEADKFVVNISDNGPGISPSDIHQVFDYLFTTKGDRGMGFGLAISRRIVRAHGGDIRARSIWGYSTEMSVELPKSLIL